MGWLSLHIGTINGSLMETLMALDHGEAESLFSSVSSIHTMYVRSAGGTQTSDEPACAHMTTLGS
jgi:hypothetical protein